MSSSQERTCDSWMLNRPSSVLSRGRPGGPGLQLTTRLNGQIVQRADTSEMIYGTASVIAFLSAATTFHPGDFLVMEPHRASALNETPSCS